MLALRGSARGVCDARVPWRHGHSRPFFDQRSSPTPFHRHFAPLLRYTMSNDNQSRTPYTEQYLHISHRTGGEARTPYRANPCRGRRGSRTSDRRRSPLRLPPELQNGFRPLPSYALQSARTNIGCPELSRRGATHWNLLGTRRILNLRTGLRPHAPTVARPTPALHVPRCCCVTQPQPPTRSTHTAGA